MKVKPRLVKGTRDFLPEQVNKRKYILNTIQTVFKKFGFQEIETPAIELLETLTGKYGEEGDKLLFKILNSGDFLSKADDQHLQEKDSKAITASISEKGLRYDLTVPLARYVVQHQNELNFPFKRFHIGPVWRADRPQKGRYREFFQCDADIIGSTSLLNETELTLILAEAFEALGLSVKIQLNNRKILEGIIETVGVSEQYKEILIAIDKMDKIGEEGVTNELQNLQLTAEQITELFALFSITDLHALANSFKDKSAIGEEGCEEMTSILNKCSKKNVVFAPALARGLDYYTGTIWEVVVNDVAMGTIAAGGRYDNLTEMFGGQNMSGVGISFGIERIYDVLEELNQWPADITTSTKVLIINFGNEGENVGWQLLQSLRNSNIPSELFPDDAKLKKQMSYADKKNIPYVIFIGEEEIKTGKYSLKAMTTGEQNVLGLEELIEVLK
ncbi:MAG: histidine--tRNA ligase [Bacteroidetes bacterium]|nr:histidine--tRNA ligase [Bacteroidota bacterium]